jgi:hypothetical protein
MSMIFSQALPSDISLITELDPLHRDVAEVADYTIAKIDGKLVAFVVL